MRPAIEVWKEAIGVCFREYGVEDGEAATAVIEVYAAEREAAAHAKAVAEIVAELRSRADEPWDRAVILADHIQAKFGGRDG